MKMQLYNKIMEIKEMSVPVYVGINIHIQIRNTILVEQMHSLGWSSGYRHFLRIKGRFLYAIAER